MGQRPVTCVMPAVELPQKPVRAQAIGIEAESAFKTCLCTRMIAVKQQKGTDFRDVIGLNTIGPSCGCNRLVDAPLPLQRLGIAPPGRDMTGHGVNQITKCCFCRRQFACLQQTFALKESLCTHGASMHTASAFVHVTDELLAKAALRGP